MSYPNLEFHSQSQISCPLPLIAAKFNTVQYFPTFIGTVLFLSSYHIIDRHQLQWPIVPLIKNNSTHPLLQCCHLRNRCFGMDFFCHRFSCRQLPRLRLIGCRQLPRQRLIGCLQLLNRQPEITSISNAAKLDFFDEKSSRTYGKA